MTLRELSLRTKIGVKYLEAIEIMDPANLPRAVYLRGYLREIARVYHMKAADLIDEYIAFLGNS